MLERMSKLRAASYAVTTRLIKGEPCHLPTGTRVWIVQRSGTKRQGFRFQVASELGHRYWVYPDDLAPL